jgi:hypothetical protein
MLITKDNNNNNNNNNNSNSGGAFTKYKKIKVDPIGL